MYFKKLLFLSLFFCCSIAPIFAQSLYSKAYGDRENPALIYVHGGPRGNSTLFEGTTAQALADLGYYVIVYDRRGEGRSADANAKINFDEAFNDLQNLITSYHLAKVNLIGHSFGGLVSTLFADRHPEKVERLILVGALFAQQESYDHILTTAAERANRTQDTISLKNIAIIKTLDTQSAAYRKLVYEIASHFGYFKMPKPTKESAATTKKYESGPFYKQNIRNDLAPILFYKNESMVNIDTKRILNLLAVRNVKLFSIYGKDDGIFSTKQLTDMKKIVGRKRFYLIGNCSHYPFVDQQIKFLKAMKNIMEN